MRPFALIALVMFTLSVGPPASAQDTLQPDQKAGKCSILIEGNGNTASIRCESIDPNLAAQLRELVNASRRDETTKKDFSEKLDQIISMIAQLNRGDQIEVSVQRAPRVGLGLIYSKAPSLVIYNESNVVARDIIWQVVLWDVDSQDPQPLPIPTGSIEWLRPNEPSGPMEVFQPYLSKLKQGTHLLGSAIVTCATCAQGRTYIIDLTSGQGGWFSEATLAKPGRVIVPADTSAEGWKAFFSSLQAAVPIQKRISIKESPPE